MLAVRFERALERILADLAREEDQVALEPVRKFLQALVRHATERVESVSETIRRMREGMEDPATVPEAPNITDPDVARIAFDAVRRMQQAMLHASLAYVSVSGDTALEIEEIFEVLSQAEGALVDRWLSTESLRRADLLARVFHDLRSPLTSVYFLSDALYSGVAGSLSDTQRRQVQMIYTAAHSLMTLVDNVLSSRNIEVGKLRPERVPFCARSLAEEVERTTRPLAEERGLVLDFECGCHAGRVGDPDVLRRILLNLITNAVSYTEEGGVFVRLEEGDGELVATVEDTGPGIDDEQMEELFSAFRSSAEPRSGRNRFSSTGLGLALCHRLARFSGGDIWVESELDQGSTFGVRLPFPPIERGGEAEQQSPESAGLTRRSHRTGGIG